MEENKCVKNVHKGHRERLREKVIKNGINSLAEHEVMELILFYSLAQRNTNDLAHKLIDSFGSVSKVLDASEDELMKIKGISKTTVFILKSIPQISSYYLNDKNNRKTKRIHGCNDAFKFIAPKFVGQTRERIMMIFLSNASEILGYDFVSQDIINSTQITSRKIIELCIKYNATRVIIAHNHPSGLLTPSSDDFITTKMVIDCLKTIDVELLDHMIIGKGEYLSMANDEQFQNMFEEKQSQKEKPEKE